ncbi:MAG TPA: methylaspartate ammonia-lyase [Trebonia sp.]|jgi:methylaspartate ammonia-lyase|nr:methylaspartate ammonia-lyase [Trebonia sp.]
MRITQVLSVPVRTGFFADDQAAIRIGAETDGFTYTGAPVTPGFTAIRQAGEAVSVMLVLDDGYVAQGDCAAVQYSGVGGRDSLFRTGDGQRMIEREVVPALTGRELTAFRGMAPELDALPVHTAVRYGISQALLDAVAHERQVTMAELVRDEYQTGVTLGPVPMFVQCGEDRYDNVDKMILKGADALPHGLINNVAERLGTEGELFETYLRWVRDRVLSLRTREDYAPVLHFDTYGTIGLAFGLDTTRMADYLSRLGDLAAPFRLRVEQPMDAGSRDAQLEAMGKLRAGLRERGSQVEIVIDEWCNTMADIRLFTDAQAADVIHVKTPDLGGVSNTVDALLYVRRKGLAAYCGGTCNETDLSARVCTQLAMACGADQVLAKPGMGVDEGLMIVGNEMARVTTLARARTPR